MDFDWLFKFFFIINKRARIINILNGNFKWITDLRKFYSIIYIVDLIFEKLDILLKLNFNINILMKFL